MRITSRGLAAVTVGLVTAVVLAGCSSDSTKPTVLPSLQTTTAPSTSSPAATTPAPVATSPVAVPPVTTSAAPRSTTSANPLATTDREIANAVRAYYATVNRALHDQAALAEMRKLFGPGCTQCVSDAKNFSNVLDRKWKVTGGTYQILTVKGTATTATSGSATVTFNVLDGTALDAKGKVVAQESSHRGRSEGLTVAMIGGKWMILGYISFGSTK